jgi:hypothetical protein
MEDVLGGRADAARFAAYLADWRTILDRRIDEAVAAFAGVDGVVGLILAGSTGRGEAWPLSDIDLLPIYAADRIDAARDEVERRRVAILPGWTEEGWWTGLDIGKLAYTRDEVTRVLQTQGDLDLFRDDRWYFGLDKGFQGREVFDPEGLAAGLAGWFTANRFAPPVVRFRLDRTRRELAAAHATARSHRQTGDAVRALIAIQAAVKWLWTDLLESWSERDSSQGRLGARFARLATAHGLIELATALDDLCDLDPASVSTRMAAAPDWVHERHDRSWRSRHYIGEPVTHEEDARDTLRVCALYELRRWESRSTAHFPEWLAIPTAAALDAKVAHLSGLIARWLPEPAAGTPPTCS